MADFRHRRADIDTAVRGSHLPASETAKKKNAIGGSGFQRFGGPVLYLLVPDKPCI